MKINADPKLGFIKYTPKQIKYDNFNSKSSQAKQTKRLTNDKKSVEIYTDDINFLQTQDFKPNIKLKNKTTSHTRNSSMKISCELNRNNITYNTGLNYINANYPNFITGKKLQKANSSIVSTGEDTQRSRYTSSKEKYSKKTSPNPRINPQTYFPADNKFLKMKIPKIGNANANTKALNSKDCLTSRPSSKFGNSMSTSSNSTLNNTIKNSTLRIIYNKEEEISKSRNDKLKLIEKKSEMLYNKKTFTTDNETREKIKNEIDQIKMKKELENCTFKPKIQRNSISAFTSRTSSPVMTSQHSIIDASIGTAGNTYDRQMEWKSKVKNRNDQEKTCLFYKESLHCSFKPQLGNSPNFEFKNKNKISTQRENSKYYERITQARREKEDGILKSLPDYTTKFDERKKKDRTNNTMDEDQYATFDPKKRKTNFKTKVEKLKKDLHNFIIDF